jgi:membrane-associated protease RseP (regulator of RpoE activity)
MLNILAVIVGFAVLIGIHEFCHMLTAKVFGVKVLKFSFGFGPRLLHYQGKETSYELRLLPLGGFVQLLGEDPKYKEKDGFFGISWYKRSLVAFAGPVSNFILGVLIIFSLFLFKQWPVVEAVKQTFTMSSTVVVQTTKYAGGFFVHKSDVSQLSGPIVTTKIMVSSLKESIGQFLLVLAVISLSLGLFNLFPIAGLDGGHVLLYTLEGIRGKPFSEKIYRIWGYVGMILLMILMIFVVYLDIVKLLR